MVTEATSTQHTHPSIHTARCVVSREKKMFKPFTVLIQFARWYEHGWNVSNRKIQPTNPTQPKPNHHFGRVIEWHCKLKSCEQNLFSIYYIYSRFFFVILTLDTSYAYSNDTKRRAVSSFFLCWTENVASIMRFRFLEIWVVEYGERESEKKGKMNTFVQMACVLCRFMYVFLSLSFSQLFFFTFCILCAICLFGIVIFIMVYSPRIFIIMRSREYRIWFEMIYYTQVKLCKIVIIYDLCA